MNEPVRSPDTPGTRRPDTSSRWSLTSILVAMAAGAGLFLAWQTAGTLLLIFAGLLFAAFLDACTRGLAFVAALGPSVTNAVLALALTGWPPYARLSRAETLTIRNADFIAAARMQGASAPRLLVLHIWPLCLSSLIVRVALDMAGIILSAAGLGFLGLGAQPPAPEWGAMISDGRTYILDHWWVAAMPGIAIFLVSLAFNFLGDGLRDVLDPKGTGE